REQSDNTRGLAANNRNLRAQLQSALPSEFVPPSRDGAGTAAAPALDVAALRGELEVLPAELTTVQGGKPLIRACVAGQTAGEDILLTINMSEGQEAHTVSTLRGAAPGYVGYGEGGVLTEAVRRRPYSVVLLDEVEKAHPDVLELFYQVFDKGHLEDGEGREIDFKNTIILLTSNACTDQMMKLCADPETMPTPQGLVAALKPELNKIFKPAFLGRMLIVPYYPIRDEALRKIVALKLDKIGRRLEENHGADFSYDAAVVDEVAS